MTVPFAQTVDIGHGRGRLAAEHAASIVRVDAAVGRPLDINSAWRSPIAQQQLRDAYLHYRRYGSPWAPIALSPDESVHCDGGAIDTDDHTDPRIVRILNDHGWYQTVYRVIAGKRVLVEPWHFERFRDRDNHRHAPAGGVAVPLPPPPSPDTQEEEEMPPRQIHTKDPRGRITRALIVPGTGYFVKWTESGATYANGIARGFETGSSTEVTKSLFDVFEREAIAQRPKDALSIEVAEVSG